MATIYDVAKRAGVSTYTVSSVLNRSAYVSPKLTKRVEQAVQELDYTINELARGLQTRKTRTVGMLIPDIANSFYARVVRGVEDVLKEAGYSLILGSTYNQREAESQYVTVFRAKQVDGFLLFISPGDEGEVQALVKAKKPIVFVGRKPLATVGDSVSADNTKGTRMAVQHLLAKGHRRIGLINGQQGLSSSIERVNGWKGALRKAGLSSPKELVYYGNWTAAAGFAATQHFLQLAEPPTALFTANLLMMVGSLRALQERKIPCPERVEVMSSDDSEWLDVFSPRISTVAQPSYEMGTQAAQLLLKRIKAPNRRVEQVVLEPELMLRD